MDRIEQDLAAALRERAGADVDPDGLLAASLARRQAVARRRQIVAAVGVAGTTVAVLVAVPLGLGGSPSPPGHSEAWPSTTEPPPATPGQYRFPGPPVAAGVPGAAERPDLVGGNPLRIHFGAPVVPLPVDSATWGVEDGVEVLEFSGIRGTDGNAGSVRVQAARRPIPEPVVTGSPSATPSTTTRPTTVNGHPATMETRTSEDPNGGSWVERRLKWEPVDGVRVRLDTIGGPLLEADVMRMAEALRFDQAYRCGVPLRLTRLPDGAAPTQCQAWSLPDSTVEAQLTVAGGDGSVTVTAKDERVPPASMRPGPEVTQLPNGQRAAWRDGGMILRILDLGITVELTAGVQYGQDELTAVADGVRMAGELGKPETWPADPIG